MNLAAHPQMLYPQSPPKFPIEKDNLLFLKFKTPPLIWARLLRGFSLTLVKSLCDFVCSIMVVCRLILVGLLGIVKFNSTGFCQEFGVFCMSSYFGYMYWGLKLRNIQCF